MKKTFLLCAVLAAMSVNTQAQSLKSLLKFGKSVVTDVAKSVLSGDSNSSNSSNSSSSSSNSSRSSESYETVQNSFASDSGSSSGQGTQPMRIVTNNPYIKVNVTKCVANGKTVMLEFKLTNTSGNDAANVGISIGRSDCGINVYDDQGNEYSERALALKYANKQFETWAGSYTLLADVPAKFTLKIDGVSTSAESFARIVLPFEHNGLGLKIDTPITLRNIPINRE